MEFSKIFYRFKVYGIGFLIGLVLVNFLFKGRSICRLPGTLKLEELQKQKTEYTEHARCRMKCRGINEKDIADVVHYGHVNYSKSEVHAKPCPKYAIEGKTNDGKEIRIIIGDCDSISRIITTIDMELEKDTCGCR